MTRIINYWLIISAFFCFAACTESESTLPIDEEKLKEILIDVHLAEAALQPIISVKKDSLTDLYFSQVFEIHQVHPVDFEASMEILQKDPDRMRKLYRELTEEVKKKKTEFKRKKDPKKEQAKSTSELQQDSLSQ